MDFPQQFICATEEYNTYTHFVPAPYFRKKLPEFFKRTGRRKEGGDA